MSAMTGWPEDFAASVKAGEESVAQVSGVREQAILTQAIRSELKTQACSDTRR